MIDIISAIGAVATLWFGTNENRKKRKLKKQEQKLFSEINGFSDYVKFVEHKGQPPRTINYTLYLKKLSWLDNLRIAVVTERRIPVMDINLSKSDIEYNNMCDKEFPEGKYVIYIEYSIKLSGESKKYSEIVGGFTQPKEQKKKLYIKIKEEKE